MSIILTVLSIYLILLVLCPFIFKYKIKGKNAVNTPFFIIINPELDKRKYYCVLAQEYYESRIRLINPLYSFLVFLSLFGYHKFMRKMEIMGHAIEIAYAKKNFSDYYDIDEYRKKEAKILANKYKCFKGVPEEDIYRRLIEADKKASSWVKNMSVYIGKL